MFCSRGKTPELNWNVKEMVDGTAPGKLRLETSLHSSHAYAVNFERKHDRFAVLF